MGVKVLFSEEQMEMLRKQIAAFSIICKQLVQMHLSLSSSQHPSSLPPPSPASGMPIATPYYPHYPYLPSNIHKIPSRQRWQPKPVQLQILEGIFEQCSATPSRQRIKEITDDLKQHGQISETNVYNWFQNRRARSKRKKLALTPDNPAESEVVPGVEVAQEKKKMKPEDIQHDENTGLLIDQLNFHSPDIGLDQLIGKMDMSLSYCPYWQMEQQGEFG